MLVGGYQLVQANSYLVDSGGSLITALDDSSFEAGDLMTRIFVVKAMVVGEKWPHKKYYRGINSDMVFGSLSKVDRIGLGIFTEINREDVLQSVFILFTKVVILLALVVIFFLCLGMRMLKLVINSIDVISTDFKRVAKQDYTFSVSIGHLVR